MKRSNRKVCMLSYAHQMLDDRIYWKEALSLKKNGYEVMHIGSGKEDKQWVTEEGITIIQLKRKQYHPNHLLNKIIGSFFPSKDILKKMLTLAKQEKAAVYHVHDFQVNTIVKQLKQQEHQPVLINDVHDANVDLARSYIPNVSFFRKIAYFFYGTYIHAVERKFVTVYDAIITAEQYVASLYKKYGAPENKIQVIYNYSYFFPVEQKLGSPLYDFIYAGTITKDRGIFDIIDAIEIVKKQLPSVKGIIIGKFANEVLNKEASNLIREKRLDDNIILHDPVPHNKIASFYTNSKIGLCLLYPNKKYLHAIPIKLFEYMAFGLPVISSDNEAARKYIQETGSGLLVNLMDKQSIAVTIIRLLTNNELYQKMSEKGRQAVKNAYHWQYEEKKLLQLYKDLLNL